MDISIVAKLVSGQVKKCVAIALAGSLATAAHAEWVLNVTVDYDVERSHAAVQGVFQDLAQRMQNELRQPVRLVMTQNAERVGERIRTKKYDLILAPSHLIGVAMRHHYVPIAKTQQTSRTVLIARPGVNAQRFEDTRGMKAVLPHPESLVSYMVRGELNAKGTTPARHFANLTYVNKYPAVIYAADIGHADVIALREDTARDWLARNAGARIVQTFAAVPKAGLAVDDRLSADEQDRIRNAFLRASADLGERMRTVSGMSDFVAAKPSDFEFVSTRGYFTPEVLPGATIVTAEQVKRLMDQGVPLFDVRLPSLFREEGHIPGAINVPYEINSPKEADADDSVDLFDLSKLPQDKNAPLIVLCSGAECWYSYKAARYLVKRGYKKVYWFRTGLPAWKKAGYPVRQGA